MVCPVCPSPKKAGSATVINDFKYQIDAKEITQSFALAVKVFLNKLQK